MFLTSPDLSLQISPPAEPTNSTHLTQQNTFSHNHIYDQPRLSLGLDHMGALNHHHHHPNMNTLTFQPQHQIYPHDDFKRRPSRMRRIRSPRIRWTSTLHDHFIRAVQLLGGHQRATPKSVQELMNVKDLTLAHVKSHLQMYRTVKSTDKGAAGLVADQMQVISVSPPPTALQSQRRSWTSSFETNDSHHSMKENTSSDRCLSPFSKADEVDEVVTTLHLPKKMKLSSSSGASEKLLNLEFTLGIQHTD